MIFALQRFKKEASQYEKYRRLRMSRHQENWFAAAAPNVPTALSSRLLEKEARTFFKVYFLCLIYRV